MHNKKNQIKPFEYSILAIDRMLPLYALTAQLTASIRYVFNEGEVQLNAVYMALVTYFSYICVHICVNKYFEPLKRGDDN